MPRLFSGLVLPDNVRQHLSMLKSPVPGAKWVEPENLHLSLRFVGDIDNHQAADFADALGQINHAPFEIRLQGLGVFGGKTPTSLWAGVSPNPSLLDLARRHEKAARQAGLAPLSRKFTAHVTLARLRHTKPHVVARFLQHNGRFEAPPFQVDAFVLFSARPRTGGGPYVIEHTYPLRHAAPQAGMNMEPVNPQH